MSASLAPESWPESTPESTGGAAASPPTQHVVKHAPDPCGPWGHLYAPSRVPPWGQSVVSEPQTQLPPAGVQVSVPFEPDVLPDVLPEDVEDAEVEDVDELEVSEPLEVEPAGVSSELQACIASKRSVAADAPMIAGVFMPARLAGRLDGG